MDSTAQYGFGEMHDGTVSSSEEALNDPNPWNTYVHTGLPIGPIANPGDVAIDAAMHPADGAVAVLRHRQPRHRRDRSSPSTYSEHHAVRRPVAAVVHRPPGLGVLSAARDASRGLGRPDRAQPVAAAARRRVRACSAWTGRTSAAASTRRPSRRRSPTLDDSWRGLSLTMPLKGVAFAAASTPRPPGRADRRRQHAAARPRRRRAASTPTSAASCGPRR